MREEQIPCMVGKIDRLLDHLISCAHVSDHLRDRARDEKAQRRRTHKQPPYNKENIPPSAPPRVPLTTFSPSTGSQHPSLSVSDSMTSLTPSDSCSAYETSRKRQRAAADDGYYETASVEKWPSNIQDEFAADLCRLLVACNIAWWAVEHPYFRHFFSKWLPMAILPGRKTLSGRVLDTEAGKVTELIKRDVRDRFCTGQCDGWKNIAKSALVASIVNVEYAVSSSILSRARRSSTLVTLKPKLLNVFDISAAVKNAENLLTLVLAEIQYCQDVLKVTLVAWCTDASGESRKMRRLLKERLPWIVTVDCWAHQVRDFGHFYKSDGRLTICTGRST